MDGCAPIKSASEKGCSGRYVSCIYNYPVYPRDIRAEYGGSILIEAESQGVMTSPCSHKGHAVYVKYAISGVNGQPTPLPTLHPTQFLQRDTTIVNGFNSTSTSSIYGTCCRYPLRLLCYWLEGQSTCANSARSPRKPTSTPCPMPW